MECEGDPPLSEAGDWKMSGRGVKGAVDLDGEAGGRGAPPHLRLCREDYWESDAVVRKVI